MSYFAANRTPYRLWTFVAGSVCLHTALFLAATSSPDFTVQPATPLTISLSLAEPEVRVPPKAAPPKKVAPRRTPTPPPNPTAATTPTAPAAETLAEATTATEPMAEETAPAAPPPQADDTVQKAAQETAPTREQIQTQVQALLRADLVRYFQYPSIARRRGWQGEVLVSITVKPDGVLERVHIMQSSGYDILDRSALDALTRVQRLTDARPWLQGRTLELLLPVVYRLTD